VPTIVQGNALIAQGARIDDHSLISSQHIFGALSASIRRAGNDSDVEEHLTEAQVQSGQ
jgi:hypothetical protein